MLPVHAFPSCFIFQRFFSSTFQMVRKPIDLHISIKLHKMWMQIKQQYVVGSGTLDLIYRTSVNSRVDSMVVHTLK